MLWLYLSSVLFIALRVGIKFVLTLTLIFVLFLGDESSWPLTSRNNMKHIPLPGVCIGHSAVSSVDTFFNNPFKWFSRSWCTHLGHIDSSSQLWDNNLTILPEVALNVYNISLSDVKDVFFKTPNHTGTSLRPLGTKKEVKRVPCPFARPKFALLDRPAVQNKNTRSGCS